MVLLYIIGLLLINDNIHLSPLLVSCSSISFSSSHINNNTSSLSSMLCHSEESDALLGFINSLSSHGSLNMAVVDKAKMWTKGTDCCGWDGITCHPTSHHVVELNLASGGLVGNLDSNNTLFHLRHLRSLDLSFNDFRHSTISPIFGSSFPYMEDLYLGRSNFRGEIPVEISQLSKLQSFMLADNIFYDIENENENVFEMKMSTLDNIISNMTQLEALSLGRVNINSTFPPSLTNLSSLIVLKLRECNLRGELPANLFNLPQLYRIDLGRNHDLHANFPLSNWSTSLSVIDLSYVNFSSTLPSSSSLTQNSELSFLHLRGCNLYGRIPEWMWNIIFCKGPFVMDLSDNKFNGTINYNCIHSLIPPNLDGPWTAEYLNVSHNDLTGTLTTPYSTNWNFEVLDLSYNMFYGPLPVSLIGYRWFSVSNNNFTGSIPSSVCNLTTLRILDLSNNSLMNELPHCLGNLGSSLVVLNLGSNFISGTFPIMFSKCDNLGYLDLSNNLLEELGPRSLAHCKKLQVLNLRNNKFREEFPQCLATLPYIQVVDLSCNGFFGSLVIPKVSNPFPRLLVLDLSNNYFSGKISRGYVEKFKAMMNVTKVINEGPVYLDSGDIYGSQQYFYSTTLTRNGVPLKYDKIITTLAAFDLSNNKFEGEIPDNLGKLVLIHGLNLSYNQLIGPIPRSLGNLTLLDFLDLSYNKLTGQIPQELTSLTSLGVFNVSENQLIGPIPHGKNFDTFSVDSYNGNLGLCGFPLSDCGENGGPMQQPSKNDNEDDDVGMMSEWKVAMMGCGFGTFVSFVWGCYMLSIGRPFWLLKLVLILVDKVEKMFGRNRPRRVRN